MIQIYQIYYNNDHIPFLEPDTIHYNNSKDPTRGFEYGVMFKHYNQGLFNNNETLVGFISWKWRQKTGITTQKFKEMIEANPGKDCYAFNPFPQHVYSYNNIWIDGERWHPGIIDLTQKMFDYQGYNIDLRQRIHTLENSAYCNYWVATKDVWDKYIKFIEPFRELMLKEEWRPHEWNYPYIIERLFSEFVQICNINIKVFNKGLYERNN